MENETSEKKCTACGEVKSLKNYYKYKGTRKGYRSECRDCGREGNTKYRNTEIGYLKARYNKMYRKGKEFKRLLTLEEFLAAWEKHKSIYGMRSAWGPGIHNLEQHKIMTTTYLGNRSKITKSNLSVDRLDSSKDYTVQNIIFICGEENARKKDTSYEDCKIQIRLYEERFKNEIEK